MANFAPYQDVPPETDRAASPPPRITSPKPGSPSPRPSRDAARPPPRVQSPSFQRDNGGSYHAPGAGWGDDEQIGRGDDEQTGRGAQMDVFETRLGLRMDVEACLAYLALPPVGGVVLLILEHKSDYVRYWFCSVD